jgi:hypothetical protein
MTKLFLSQLKLTCARGEIPRPMHTFFRPPPAEPVRPIDPTAWVQHTNAARGLDVPNERDLNVQKQQGIIILR